MNRDKRFLRLNLLLPLSAGVLLVISIIFLATPRPFAEPEIIEIFDITEELNQCFSDQIQLDSYIHCSVDVFSFSDSSYHILATNSQQCESVGIPPGPLPEGPPSKIERIGGVYFLLSSNFFPYPNWHHYHCGYRLTIQFENGERSFGEFFFQDFGPRPEYHRYDFTLTRPSARAQSSL